MRRFLCLILLLCAAALLLVPASAEEAAPADALEMTRRMGNGTNLGNTLEACNNGAQYGNTTDDPTYYETLWGQPVTTPEMLQAMKAAGFDSIRIPVAWMTNATHLGKGVGDYTISEAYLDRVEEIVNYALDAGMIVIVNDHWDGGWYGMFGSESEETRALAMEAYKGMWTQIATRFADYDWRLVFEGANEEIGARFDENAPLYCQDSVTTYLTDNQRYALANEVNQTFVDTVRAAGGRNADRFLLIPGYGTNIEQTCNSRFAMPRDSAEKRLLISVHCYSPWSYCGEGSSRDTATKWGTAANFRSLESELKMMTKFTAQGYGVVIGEYGVLPAADGLIKENTVTYHRFFLDLCDYYDYASCLWDTSGFFVRRNLAWSDAELGELYAGRSRASEGELEDVKAAAKASMDAALAAAPETFQEGAIKPDENTIVAWIMWSSGDWSVSYSVGDTYDPDSISGGVVPTVAVIDGAGDYTVGLDFTGTANGSSASLAFAAIGLSNAETINPGWALQINEVKINGKPYTMKGRPYTTSDDGKCTRVNLFNEWVTAIPGDARVLYGPTFSVSATPFDRNDPLFSAVKTIEISFTYGPKK